MTVDFRATKVLGALDINTITGLKERIELVIAGMAEQVLAGVDASNLEQIIVTDKFVDDVLAFQQEHLGGVKGVTNNEYGRAFGKMIFDPTGKRYYIFLYSEYLSFLLDDAILEPIVSKMPNKLKDEVLFNRRCAINLLAHELEHFKFAITQKEPDLGESLDDQIKKLLYQLFDEYCACRNSMAFSDFSLIPYDEGYMQDIEEHIMDNRLKYNWRNLSLDDFVGVFHAYTRQALMNIAANLGAKHGTENATAIFENCLCGGILHEIETEFDSLYSTMQADATIDISDALVAWIKNYYELFGVSISETPDGLYYDIP